MDMPPQAPPAHVTTQEQPATDALQRLADAQAWLLAQRERFPLPPDNPTAAMAGDYLAAMEAAAATPVSLSPGDAPQPLVDALAARLAGVMRDDAALRALDGTLDSAAAAAIRQWIEQRGTAGSPLVARQLRFGGTPYAGAVVLEDTSADGKVWLFMPDSGWEGFPTLDQMNMVMEIRFNERLAREDALPGMTDEDMRRAVDGGAVLSAAIEGDALHEAAAAMLRVKRGKAVATWQHFADEMLSAHGLADELHALRSLDVMIDIAGMLDQRDARLFAAANDARLAKAPANVASGWHEAVAAYQASARRASDVMLAGPEAMPLSLAEYSRSRLRDALMARGITDDPDDIVVTVSDLTPPSSLLGQVTRLINGATTQRMGLVAFAFNNAAGVHAQAARVDGSPLSATVSGDAIVSMVRELNLHERYPAYLAEHASSPRGHDIRQASLDAMRDSLRFAAADARISYYVPGEPSSFMFDVDERGYRQVEAVIASPGSNGRPTVGGHAITVHQLTYRDTAVSGVLVISAASAAAAPRIVAWTPGAPDGKDIREFESRAQMATEFLHAPQFEAYLLERLPMEFAATDASGHSRFNTDGTQLAVWVFSQGGVNGTRTEEPFSERLVTGDAFAAMDDAATRLIARNARWMTRSTSDADSTLHAALAASIAGNANASAGFIADMALETVHAVPHLFQNAWRFYDAVKDGDETEAFLAAVDGYKAMLAVVPGPVQGATGVRAAWVRAVGGRQGLVPSRVRVPAAGTVFEKRFAAPGVRAADATSVEQGIYRVQGNPYVEQGGAMFAVRYDRDIGGWRLARPASLDSSFTGPAIEWLGDSRWSLRTDVGLRGGSGRGRPIRSRVRNDAEGRPYPRHAPMAHRANYPSPSHHSFVPPPEILSLLRDPRRFNNELLALSSEQLRVFWQDLRTRAGHDARPILTAMYANDAQSSVALSATQRLHWNESLRVARSMPSVPATIPTVVPGESVGSVVDLSIPRIEGMHRLSPAEWPDQIWYYTPLRNPDPYRLGMTLLPQQRLGSQVLGVPSLTLPPSTPMGQAYASARGTMNEAAPIGSVLTSMRIDLRRLRTRTTPEGRPVVDLYRVNGGNGTALVIRPAPTAMDPLAARPVMLELADYSISQPPRRW